MSKKEPQTKSPFGEWLLLIDDFRNPIAYMHIGCKIMFTHPFDYCPECGTRMKFKGRTILHSREVQ